MDWTVLLDQWGDRLFLYARQFVASEAAAADIVQDAFVRIWKRQTQHPVPDADIPALCFGVVRHTALDHLRQCSRRIRRETLAGESLYPEPTLFILPAEQREEHAALEQALVKLPLRQREVVTLKIWGGLTFREIAETLGESPNTIASRYRLALEALRQTLDPGAPPS